MLFASVTFELDARSLFLFAEILAKTSPKFVAKKEGNLALRSCKEALKTHEATTIYKGKASLSL